MKLKQSRISFNKTTPAPEDRKEPSDNQNSCLFLGMKAMHELRLLARLAKPSKP